MLYSVSDTVLQSSRGGFTNATDGVTCSGWLCVESDSSLQLSGLQEFTYVSLFFSTTAEPEFRGKAS